MRVILCVLVLGGCISGCMDSTFRNMGETHVVGDGMANRNGSAKEGAFSAGRLFGATDDSISSYVANVFNDVFSTTIANLQMPAGNELGERWVRVACIPNIGDPYAIVVRRVGSTWLLEYAYISNPEHTGHEIPISMEEADVIAGNITAIAKGKMRPYVPFTVLDGDLWRIDSKWDGFDAVIVRVLPITGMSKTEDFIELLRNVRMIGVAHGMPVAADVP